MEFTQRSHPSTLRSVQCQRTSSWSALKLRRVKEWAGKMRSITHYSMSTESFKDHPAHVTHQNQASAQRFSTWTWSRKHQKSSKDDWRSMKSTARRIRKMKMTGTGHSCSSRRRRSNWKKSKETWPPCCLKTSHNTGSNASRQWVKKPISPKLT